MGTLLTRPQLAAKIKAKYPDYADIDDYELVNKVVAKYPEYGDVLDPEMPDFAGVESVGSSPAEVKKFPPPPANAPSIGPGKKLAPDPSTAAEGLDRLMQTIGFSRGGGMHGTLHRSLEEEPLNESDFAATGKGLASVAATAAAPFGLGAAAGLAPSLAAGGATIPQAAGMAPWALARAAGGGLAGAKGGKYVGRSLGEQFDIPEIGAALGEAGGGLGGGYAGLKSGPMLSAAGGKLTGAGRATAGALNGPRVEAGLDAATLLGVPGAGRVGAAARIAQRAMAPPPIAKPLASAVAEAKAAAKAALEAEQLAKMERLHAVNSGGQPGPAFPPPPGMGASGLPPPEIRPGAPVSGSGLAVGPAGSAPPGFGAAGPAPLPRRVPGAPSTGSGLAPGPAGEAPSGMGASIPPRPTSRPQAPTSLTPQVPPSSRTAPGRAAKAAGASMEFRPSQASGSATLAAPKGKGLTPPPAPASRATVLDDVKTAKTHVDRTVVIREARAGGASSKEVGKKLSSLHDDAAPIDADDLAKGKKILELAGGSVEKAQEILSSLTTYTAAEKRGLLRVIKRAFDAK